MKTKPKVKLPKWVRAKDLERPSYRSKDRLEWEAIRQIEERIGIYPTAGIELWLVGDWGWVVPTLTIRQPGRRAPVGAVRRSYGVRVDTGELVRVGLGPHVQRVERIWLRKSTLKRLEPLLALAEAGAVKAHQARDRRSSRALRRLVW